MSFFSTFKVKLPLKEEKDRVKFVQITCNQYTVIALDVDGFIWSKYCEHSWERLDSPYKEEIKK